MGDIMKHDKIINIAIGKSRKELNYVNLKLPYSEFIDKYIKNTKYTNETFDEYINFPKDIQDNIKDVGGFVGGILKDGKRRKDTILNRSLITLDVDFGYEGMIEDLEKNIDFGLYVKCCKNITKYYIFVKIHTNFFSYGIFIVINKTWYT